MEYYNDLISHILTYTKLFNNLSIHDNTVQELCESIGFSTHTVIGIIVFTVSSFVCLLVYGCCKAKPFKVPLSLAHRFQDKYGISYNEIFNADGTLRFRKRDKMMFYGRKMLRKVRSLAKISMNSGRRNALRRKHELVMKLTKKWLSNRNTMLHSCKDQPQRLMSRELPAAFLETESLHLPADLQLPAEVYFLLRSVRVLGHFEKPIFLELCRFMEVVNLQRDDFLFRIGDNDDSIYVVQNGRVQVFIKDMDHHEHLVKDVAKGDNIYSLLSLHDILMGNSSVYKTVFAIAKEETTVIRLPMSAFRAVLSKYPDSMIRIVQMILVRLQRVTFMALYNYLSLSNELVNPRYRSDLALLCHKLHGSHQGAPMAPVRPSLLQRQRSMILPARDAFDVYPSGTTADYYYPPGDSITPTPSTVTTIPDSATPGAAEFSPIAKSTTPTTTGATGATMGQRTRRDSCDCHHDNDHYDYPHHSTPYMEPAYEDNIAPLIYSEAAERKANRRCSEPPVKHRQSFGGIQITDFETACQQAGVTPLSPSSLKQQRGSLKGKPAPPISRDGSKEISFDTTTEPITIKSSWRKKRPGSLIEQLIDHPKKPEEVLSRYRFLDDYEIADMVKKDIAKILNLKDSNNLDKIMTFMQAKSGRTLIRQGDLNVGLYFIVTGQLAALQKKIQSKNVGLSESEKHLFISHPGSLIGALAVLTGEPSFFTFRTLKNCYLVHISKQDFYRLMVKEPGIVLHAGNTVIQRMSSFVRQIDFALDWVQLESGHALFKQGDKSDTVYIVLNGRLRSIVIAEGSTKREFAGEHGRGEIVGLLEVVTSTPRATTIMAVRDTELAQIPEGLLSFIKRFHPQVVMRLIGLLSQRILGAVKGAGNNTIAIGSLQANSSSVGTDPMIQSVSNLSTIAVFSVGDVPLSNFTAELKIALADIGSSLILTSEVIEETFGSSAMDIVNTYRLTSWLSQQEDLHRIVVYQCDTTISAWTRRCLRQADCLLIVAKHVNGGSKMGDIENEIENLAARAQKELILLREYDSPRPTDTVEWLNSRTWCSSHHHIVGPERMFTEHDSEAYKEYAKLPIDRLTDFSRLARFLTGTTVGLVLGGGGARGFAHIGVIQAMQEFGIPIDMVCGTSIGSLIGALWASEYDLEEFKSKGHQWSMIMSPLWRKLLDLTYPITSMFSGTEFNSTIQHVLGDIQIEDMKIPYFCVTTDISTSKMRVHSSGGVWRYVRASMSLSGYLPPMCDPLDGNLLLDGGYVNNLPADVMKTKGAQTIIAVDVGNQDDMELTNYGDQLSGWWLLWKKWNPWATSIKVPNKDEIQSRLAYVSCVQQLETLKAQGFMEYIRPPIEKIQTLQFHLYNEIFQLGLKHARDIFSGWVAKGLINKLFLEKRLTRDTVSITNKKTDLSDLADLISRIDDLSDKTPILPAHFEQLMSDYDGEASDDDNWSIASEPLASFSGDCDQVIHLRERAFSAGTSPINESSSEQFLSFIEESNKGQKKHKK